jgi:hypothetical protein
MNLSPSLRPRVCGPLFFVLLAGRNAALHRAILFFFQFAVLCDLSNFAALADAFAMRAISIEVPDGENL